MTSRNQIGKEDHKKLEHTKSKEGQESYQYS